MKLSSKRWSTEQFLEIRKEVLAKWPTGKDIDLDEAVEYRKTLPPSKIDRRKLEKAAGEGRTLINASVGHATVEQNIEHMKWLEQEKDFGYFQFFGDAYTRKSKYQDAERGIKESLEKGKSMMNGYPIVNHGLKKARQINDTIKAPIHFICYCDEDPRLTCEMALASGFCGGTHDLHDVIQHSKNYPLDKRIQNSQYNSRLAGYYVDRGVDIGLWSTAGLLCGWDPSSIKVVVSILGCLVAAEQGPKNFNLPVGATCNILQDIAAIRVTRQLAIEYLHKMGHHDVSVTPTLAAWQGSWPPDHNRAAALVVLNTSIAVWAGTPCFGIRSLNEGSAIATKESNLAAVRVGQQTVEYIQKQRFPDSAELALEEKMLRLEVKAMIDRVFDLGEGDPAVGEVKAVQTGELDAAFSPWTLLKGKVLPVRDISGAVRYLDHGNLPLPKEVVDYHKQRIRERELAEGKKADIDMVISDIGWVSGVR